MHCIMFVGAMSTETIRYAYRLRPMVAATQLSLLSSGLLAERGAKRFTTPYADIEAVWLSFKPRGAFFTGFRTKIYIRNGKTITLDDTTYGSFFNQERQASQYRAFVQTLVEKIQRANPNAKIMGGRSFWAQSTTIVFGAVFGGLLPIMGLMKIKAGQTVLGLLFVAFAAVFLWWTWSYIRRNRLRDLSTGVPEDLLPNV